MMILILGRVGYRWKRTSWNHIWWVNKVEIVHPDTNGKNYVQQWFIGGEGGGNINITIQVTAFAGSQMEMKVCTDDTRWTLGD